MRTRDPLPGSRQPNYSVVCNRKKSTINIPGTGHLSTQDLADAINNHFSAIVRSLPPLDLSQPPAYLPATGPTPTVFRMQMWKELSRVRVDTAPGPDGVPHRLIKDFVFALSLPVSNILNSSLASGLIPPKWKRATVVPIPKVVPTPSMDKLRARHLADLPHKQGV